MKIGIVSDSHGSTRAIDRMLSHPAAEGVTLWLHAGDITPDAEYLAMVTEGKAKVRYVAGNSDWPEPGARYDDVVEAAGHRIFLTHIMRVVGRNKWNPGFCMKPLHIRQNARFFLQPLILQFKVKITLAEDIQHFQRFFLSAFVIAV